jgi:hypothetical protein
MIAMLAVCTAVGTAPFVRPDNDCTPGAYEKLGRSAVCQPKKRPTLGARVRRAVVEEYGVAGPGRGEIGIDGWSGADGELDHRVPVFLGGLTVEDNIWPERGMIPNPKDKLEFRVYRRVCFRDPYALRVVSARRIFLHDWRHTYYTWKALRIL